MSNTGTKMYTTSDLSLAAFLLMHGLRLKTANKLTGKFEFVFFDPNDEADSLSLTFIGSEFSKYDGYLRTLRSMIHRK